MPAAFLCILQVVAGCPALHWLVNVLHWLVDGLHWLDDGLNESAAHGFLFGQQLCRRHGLGAGQEIEPQCLAWSNNGVGLASSSDEYLPVSY